MSLDIHYEDAFVDEPDALFALLLEEVAWTEQMRARRTASQGIPYNYAGASYPEAPWTSSLAALRDRVGERLGFSPTNCLLNHYPSGLHSIGWHADDVSILAPDTPIAIVSLGGPRTLQLRSGTAPDFAYLPISLASGSLFVMGTSVQATHKHAIKREPGAQSRISLTFRHLVRASAPVERPRWGARD